MGALRPKVRQQPVGSQATPFAQDFLQLLQGEIAGAQPGQPIGTGLGIRDVASPDNLITGMTDVHRRETGRASADLAEMFGGQGTRFGSGVARAQTDLHTEALEGLARMLGELEVSLGEQRMRRDLGVADLFASIAGQGINPEQTIIQDRGLKTLMELLAPVAGAALGGGGGS